MIKVLYIFELHLDGQWWSELYVDNFPIGLTATEQLWLQSYRATEQLCRWREYTIEVAQVRFVVFQESCRESLTISQFESEEVVNVLQS